MLRLPLLLSLLLVATSLLSVVATDPNTPADGTPMDQVEPMCSLQYLNFTNGFALSTPFQTNWFHYTCDISKMSAPFTFQIQPQTMDWFSTVEVLFNGKKYNYRQPNGTGISNDGTVALSPYTISFPLTLIDGQNFLTVGVGCNGHGSPVLCYFQYNITCYKPPESFVVGDPQFVGLRGQSYQVHGVAGEVYNIVSDADLQYNSRFVFLDQGDCPVINGKKSKGCWSHSGSYLGDLGLKTRAGDKIYFQSGSAADGFAAIQLNGRSLEIGETVQLAGDMGTLTYNTTHSGHVRVGKWEFDFENSDMFVNQRVKVVMARESMRAHGLLGQTWRTTTYPNPIKFVQGQVDDYAIRDQDIFGDEFVYNAFN